MARSTIKERKRKSHKRKQQHFIANNNNVDTKLVYTYVERFGMSQVKKAVKGAEGESLM